MFSRKYDDKKILADKTFWQKVGLCPNCLVIRGSQFEELCGLHKLLLNERYVHVYET